MFAGRELGLAGEPAEIAVPSKVAAHISVGDRSGRVGDGGSQSGGPG